MSVFVLNNITVLVLALGLQLFVLVSLETIANNIAKIGNMPG